MNTGRTLHPSNTVVFSRIRVGLRIVVSLLMLTLLLVQHVAAQDEMPETMAYQGYLTDTDGDPANGTTTVVFRLYDQRTGGTALWEETQQGVLFTDGVFSAHLGSVESLDDVPFGGALWLGVSVNGSQELTPRVALETVPYAMSVRGLRVVPGASPTAPTPSLIGGYAGNVVGSGVNGAVIGGGGAVIGPDGGGAAHIVGADFTTIGGGGKNSARALYATIGGGYGNVAQEEYATVGGGDRNKAGGYLSFVGGGVDNRAEAEHAVIAGGLANRALGERTAVGGGENNTARGDGAFVGGGRNNEALGCYDTVAGGESNRAETDSFGAAFKGAGMSCNATVGGGRDNVASDDGATVAGGIGNTASRGRSTVGGGSNNIASGNRATVGGGRDNAATEDGATVPGGEDNQARGQNSLAAGYNARAAHDGTFVWSDNAGSFSDSLVSTAEHQFLVRATGGVGIGTNAPQGALHVTNTESNRDLVLGGTDDSLFGDDGVITSDPAYPSSDLWLASNDAVLVMLNADESAETSAFIVADADLDVLLQVDAFGVTETNHIEVQDDLKPGTDPAEGGVYRDNVVYAWAHVNGDGSVTASYGCTVSKTATGSYRVSYGRQLPNGASAIVTAHTVNDPILATAVASANQASVATKVFNGTAFVPADSGFYIQVVGRP